MKKFYVSFAAMCLSVAAFAQSQRLVVFEQFTQASCPPCATANPPLNVMLNANSTKVVSIKYQTSWPGVDPMNAQNKTDVATRVTYYGVQGVPDVSMDGGATNSPENFTTAAITKEYGVASPFSLKVTQEINKAKDSIFIEIDMEAAKDFTTAGPFYLRVALIEKTIIFTQAPGSNGEKEFYSVMRKMYPSAKGTELDLKWTKAQSKHVSFKVPIPTYIYNKAQLGVVAFLQTDNDKVVQQAAKSVSIVTGIKEEASFQTNANINVYPNPMTDAATVSIQLSESSTVTMEVVNALGQTVLSNNLGRLDMGEQTAELNTASLKPGLYFLNVYIGQQLTTQKIAINY